MASAERFGRINPTIFDKLLASHEIGGFLGSEMDELEQERDTFRTFSVSTGQRFTEKALRATVRRELAWLLNTTSLGAVVDLEPYPQVQSSVLNYGVPDLAGKSLNERLVRWRAREIRTAIATFEPRIDEATLDVDVSEQIERENSITYVIRADITAAARALPVIFRTDIEADTSAVTVRE